MSTRKNQSTPAKGKSITSLKCGDVAPDLVALHAGEISPLRAEAVRKHLGDCFACRELAFELRLAEKSFAKIPDIEPPADLVQRAMGKVRKACASHGVKVGSGVTDEDKHKNFLFRPITNTAARIAIAAGFVLLAIAFNVPSIADALGEAQERIIGPELVTQIDEATQNVLVKLF